MKPLPASSGDLIADHRFSYAEMMFANDDFPAAAEIMLGALELAPDWVAGWFRLGEYQQAAGAVAEAEQAWRMVLKLDSMDRLGAGLKLELIGASPVGASATSAFVETLFDQYADKFDHALVKTLGYQAPVFLENAIRATASGVRFSRAIDLGCGTGLMGAHLRPFVERLDGHDISAAMLSKAEARGVYDELQKSDLQVIELPPEAADLVTAADVFIYLGALERMMRVAANALMPGGVLAFTVERHEGPEPFVLRESRRYAHSEKYISDVLSANGLFVESIETKVLRMDRGEAITGLVVVAMKPLEEWVPNAA